MRKSYARWLWLGFGVAVCGYGLATGGGLAGMLLGWQLERFGFILQTSTHLVLIILLIVPPAVALIGAGEGSTSDVSVEVQARRMAVGAAVIAAVLLGGAGAALWYTLLLPDPHAAAVRVDLDNLPSGAMVEERATILQGVLQPAFELRYTESIGRTRFSVGRSSQSRHRIVPMTPPGWTPGQPVRFLVHIESPYTYKPAPVNGSKDLVETHAGLLLRGSLTPYVRRALEHKGLVVAEDVMVHSVDPDFGRVSPYVFAGGAGFLGLMSAVFAVVFAIKPGFDRRRGVYR